MKEEHENSNFARIFFGQVHILQARASKLESGQSRVGGFRGQNIAEKTS